MWAAHTRESINSSEQLIQNNLELTFAASHFFHNKIGPWSSCESDFLDLNQTKHLYENNKLVKINVKKGHMNNNHST